jgi:hypothetical protein
MTQGNFWEFFGEGPLTPEPQSHRAPETTQYQRGNGGIIQSLQPLEDGPHPVDCNDFCKKFS